jgi:adenylate cyclase
MAVVIATNVAVWEYGNLVLPLASGVLMILLLFALNMSYGFFVESRANGRSPGGSASTYLPCWWRK